MKAFAGKFKPTWSLAGVIASSASQQGNTPTPFAKKWTDDEWNLRRLIGIDNLPWCQMSKIEERTTASMDVVLEEVCRSLPHGGDHRSRKYVAKKLMQSVKKGNVTLEGLRPVASRAFSELSRRKSA
jgi:hypothetical protein